MGPPDRDRVAGVENQRHATGAGLVADVLADLGRPPHSALGNKPSSNKLGAQATARKTGEAAVHEHERRAVTGGAHQLPVKSD
jgi:hypothetical protein